MKLALGYKKKEKKDWISEDTWQTIGHRRALKKQINESEWLKEKYRKQYQETNKAVQRKARADKRAYLEKILQVTLNLVFSMQRMTWTLA